MAKSTSKTVKKTASKEKKPIYNPSLEGPAKKASKAAAKKSGSKKK